MPEPLAVPLIVVADDEPSMLSSLARYAIEAGLNPVQCETVADAIQQIETNINSGRLAAVITDLSFAGGGYEGWSVIKAAFELSRSLDLAVFSSYVYDQVIPYEINKLNPAFTLLSKGGEKEWGAVEHYFKTIRAKWDRARQLAHDDDTRRIYNELADTYAKSSLPILILGETGTGKELLAEDIAERSKGLKTRESGERLIVSVNCGALDPSLALSELFGHTKGAFTDAATHKLGKILVASGYNAGKSSDPDFIGWLRSTNELDTDDYGMVYLKEGDKPARTLFLDEVAAMPQSIMPGLLRVLETKDVVPLGHSGPPVRARCRIISATNELSLLSGSSFRKDLLYRLAGAVLTLPSLRERNPEVIREFVTESVWAQLKDDEPKLTRMEVSGPAISFIESLYLDRADEVARTYQAGNFRTLRNLMYRAALHAKATDSSGINITIDHVKAAIRDGVIPPSIDVKLDQNLHIRQVFWNALHERLGSKLAQDRRDRFGLDDLKEWSSQFGTDTAYAFIRCNQVPRMTGSKRGKYYELREIETALATGYGRGVWIGNNLSQPDVKKAAVERFKYSEADIGNKKIAEIVRFIQQNPRSPF